VYNLKHTRVAGEFTLAGVELDTMRNKLGKSILISAIGVGLVGCANKTETGALVGGGSGAAVGGLIGSMSHARAGEGALIGAGVGAIAGALVGHGMDEADKKQREQDYADVSYSQTAVTKHDVIKWTSRGTRDDVIIDRIERSGTVFHLSRQDEQDLRDAGVSEMVIEDMKATAQR
jgi:uncharacterized membrane protein